MTVGAGKRNRRIRIQAQSETQDEFGQQLTAWQDVYSCWASIASISGSRVYAASGFVSQASHEITMLWTSFAAIASAHRVVYDDPRLNLCHVYEIKAVLNTDQANKEIVLLVYELDGAE